MLRATLRSWLVLLHVRCLTALPYRLWKRALLEALAPAPSLNASPAPEVIKAFRTALRNHPGRTSCLRRAMALTRLLRESGSPARTVIGIAPTPGRIDAHAWVTVGECVIDDSPDVAERFVPISNPIDTALTPHLARSVVTGP